MKTTFQADSMSVYIEKWN